MLLSTPRSVPLNSNTILKRSAKKFFDLAQEQGWIVRAHMIDFDRVTIEAWDFDRATAAEAKSGLTVRVQGTFDAHSGAYHGHNYGELLANPRVRTVIVGSTWDEKLHDALDKLERGPKWRTASEAAAAKRTAETEARRLRHEALKASVLAAGDSALGKDVTEQLRSLSAVKDAPDLGIQASRFEDRVAEWRRAQRLAQHARSARKLIHTVITAADGTEACLTPEEAVVKQAQIVWEGMVTALLSYVTSSTNEIKADARFVRDFHPRFNPQFAHVRVIHP
jgi:hypothetical protein